MIYNFSNNVYNGEWQASRLATGVNASDNCDCGNDAFAGFFIGKLHTEEALETLLKVLVAGDIGSRTIMLNFEFDATEAQQIYIYDNLSFAGANTKKLIINGMVPKVDNITYIEKLAEGCKTVLLRGYFDTRTLNEACLSELIIVTKYLLGRKSGIYGIAADMGGLYTLQARIAAGEQYHILCQALDAAYVKKEYIDGLLNNRWVYFESVPEM